MAPVSDGKVASTITQTVEAPAVEPADRRSERWSQSVPQSSPVALTLLPDPAPGSRLRVARLSDSGPHAGAVTMPIRPKTAATTVGATLL